MHKFTDRGSKTDTGGAIHLLGCMTVAIEIFLG
jgi:hypothetical protein